MVAGGGGDRSAETAKVNNPYYGFKPCVECATHAFRMILGTPISDRRHARSAYDIYTRRYTAVRGLNHVTLTGAEPVVRLLLNASARLSAMPTRRRPRCAQTRQAKPAAVSPSRVGGAGALRHFERIAMRARRARRAIARSSTPSAWDGANGARMCPSKLQSPPGRTADSI